jgi:gentisate 1,2-dioxygenase
MSAESTPHAERSQLYRDMDPLALTPLWEVLHALVPAQPQSAAQVACWRYEAVRPFLTRAGEVITAEEAVRRVLVLENPALRGQSRITPSLYAGLQLILPGEIAPSHRHTQSALRFVVEGRGAYTAVNGERTTMEPGDFIITPNWTWHDHGSDAGEAVVWLDGLDIPMLQFFEAGFAQNGSQASQPVQQAQGTAWARWGHNMAPLRHDNPFGATSPLFSYPYARSREALAHLEAHEAMDPWDGFKLRYLNPHTGGWPMPTMGTFLQRLPAGFTGQPWRQTDGTVFSVVEGSGELHWHRDADSPPEVLPFGPRDHLVVPSWHTVHWQSPTGCVLFSFSDRPAQQALAIHREERIQP